MCLNAFCSMLSCMEGGLPESSQSPSCKHTWLRLPIAARGIKQPSKSWPALRGVCLARAREDLLGCVDEAQNASCEEDRCMRKASAPCKASSSFHTLLLLTRSGTVCACRAGIRLSRLKQDTLRHSALCAALASTGQVRAIDPGLDLLLQPGTCGHPNHELRSGLTCSRQSARQHTTEASRLS